MVVPLCDSFLIIPSFINKFDQNVKNWDCDYVETPPQNNIQHY